MHPVTASTSASRVALVTGGNSGIGEAIARRFARQGLRVLIAARNMTRTQQVVAAMGREGHEAHGLHMDVNEEASVRSGVETALAAHGRLDILVNSAGVGITARFFELSLANWETAVSVNLTGAFLAGRLAAAIMRERAWGRIVNITSVAGILAGTLRCAYGTSKAGLIGLTRQMAVELACYGITVNAVAPGPVKTPMTDVMHDAATRRAFCARVPAGRYGLLEEIASAVSFLVSEEASSITGQTLAVDGGFSTAGILL